MIIAENLTKIFKDGKREIKAISDLGFCCKEGAIFGLLGPNGAGKTTTLRIIASLLKPTSGHVEIDGLDVIEHAEEIRKKIGFLTGTTGLYKYLTTQETLSYFGKLNGLDDNTLKYRIEKVVELFKMQDFLKRRIEGLSSGMKQKVSLARTIVHDPSILILDEPMTGLDIIAAKAIMDFIKQSRTEGKCILFSTHVMREAELLCDEIAIIHKGKLLIVGTLDDLRKDTGKYYLEDVFFEMIGDN